MGRLYRLISGRWEIVRYDSDGIEPGAAGPEGYREWLRRFSRNASGGAQKKTGPPLAN